MAINRPVFVEVIKMLKMTIKELREYEKGARSIPVGFSDKFSGEIIQITEDGAVYPSAELRKFLTRQRELPLINVCIQPLKAQNWYQAGLVFVEEEAFPEARDSFLRATELEPNFGDAWYNFGEVSFSKLGDKKNGRIGYTKAIECDQQDRDSVYNLGLVEFEERNLEAAERCFRKAMAIKEDQGQASYWLCATLFFAKKTDKLEQARQNLRQYPFFSTKFNKELKAMLSGKKPDFGEGWNK